MRPNYGLILQACMKKGISLTDLRDAIKEFSGIRVGTKALGRFRRGEKTNTDPELLSIILKLLKIEPNKFFGFKGGD